MEEKKIRPLMDEFHMKYETANRYIHMTEEEIMRLGRREIRKEGSKVAAYSNLIYKMIQNGESDLTIYQYIRYQGYSGSLSTIWDYIHCLEENNFPGWKQSNAICAYRSSEAEGVIRLSRGQVVRYLLTVNAKTKRDKTVQKNSSAIQQAYPITSEIHTMYQEFHKILMGSNEKELTPFIRKYEKSRIQPFCESIKKDLDSVKNAIRNPESSGFVEGGNNQFKLTKRNEYGRMKLDSLFKKFCLSFLEKRPGFALNQLLLTRFGFKA